MDVIRSPTHPANAIRLRSIGVTADIFKIFVDRKVKSMDPPSITSPAAGSVRVAGCEYIIPIIVTGTATIKPARGPDIPTSKKNLQEDQISRHQRVLFYLA